MTKSELITILSDKFSQLVHKDAELSVKTIIDSLGNALKACFFLPSIYSSSL